MEIVLASRNNKKIAELQALLSEYLPDIKVLSLDDIGFEGDIIEDGESFEENAMIKAASVAERGYIGVGDDSGLTVNALGGAPGIYSARYAGEHGDDEKNNDKLLAELEGVPLEKRTARFVSVVTCVFPDGKKIAVRGECEGKIAFERSGNGGFGYDPLFLFEDGRSFGEFTAEDKDKVSHRGKALRLLADELEKII